jgi:hypothetical protein
MAENPATKSIKVAAAVIGMALAMVLAVAAIGVFGWGAYVGAFVDEHGNNPYEPAAWLLLVSALGLGAASGGLWTVSHRLAWPERDAMDTAAVVVMVIWGIVVCAFAALAVWVVLRLTGVVGPLFFDHGI